MAGRENQVWTLRLCPGKSEDVYKRQEYRKAQADMRQAVAVKANIDHLLGHTDGRENKAQER